MGQGNCLLSSKIYEQLQKQEYCICWQLNSTLQGKGYLIDHSNLRFITAEENGGNVRIVTHIMFSRRCGSR